MLYVPETYNSYMAKLNQLIARHLEGGTLYLDGKRLQPGNTPSLIRLKTGSLLTYVFTLNNPDELSAHVKVPLATFSADSKSPKMSLGTKYSTLKLDTVNVLPKLVEAENIFLSPRDGTVLADLNEYVDHCISAELADLFERIVNLRLEKGFEYKVHTVQQNGGEPRAVERLWFTMEDDVCVIRETGADCQPLARVPVDEVVFDNAEYVPNEGLVELLEYWREVIGHTYDKHRVDKIMDSVAAIRKAINDDRVIPRNSVWKLQNGELMVVSGENTNELNTTRFISGTVVGSNHPINVRIDLLLYQLDI